MVDEVSTLDLIKRSINSKSNFILEAGAGSGKTYTLIQTLKFLNSYSLEKNQNILCITYTNVAKNEIIERLQRDQIKDNYVVSTIHDFLWSFFSSFQPELQKVVRELARIKVQKIENDIKDAEQKLANPTRRTNIENQKQIVIQGNLKLEKYANVDYSKIKIRYDKYTALYRGVVSHDEIIEIANTFMSNDFFVGLLISSFPYIMIDEYQDSDYNLITNLITKANQLNLSSKFVLGLFGDKMQQIYQDKGELDFSLFDDVIQKIDNYRSSEKIVAANNILRNDSLIQSSDCQETPIVHENLKFIYNTSDDVDLAGYLSTGNVIYKRLYLVNRKIAEDVGFGNIAEIFRSKYPRDVNEKLLKLEDPLLNFIVLDILQDYRSYLDGKYAQIIKRLNVYTLEELKNARNKITILFESIQTSISTFIESYREMFIFDQTRYDEIIESYDDLEFTSSLLSVSVHEFLSLTKQVGGETELSTMHGVKGKEFPNVIVNVLEEREWNKYDFPKLILTGDLSSSTTDRAHKLLYVSCTRAQCGLIINYICENYSSEMESMLKESAIRMFGVDIEFITLK